MSTTQEIREKKKLRKKLDKLAQMGYLLGLTRAAASANLRIIKDIGQEPAFWRGSGWVAVKKEAE